MDLHSSRISNDNFRKPDPKPGSLIAGNFVFRDLENLLLKKIGTVFDWRDYTSLLWTNFSGSSFLTIGDAINNSSLRYFYYETIQIK